MSEELNRRVFLKNSGLALLSIAVPNLISCSSKVLEEANEVAHKTEQQKLEELAKKYPSNKISKIVYDPELNSIYINIEETTRAEFSNPKNWDNLAKFYTQNPSNFSLYHFTNVTLLSDANIPIVLDIGRLGIKSEEDLRKALSNNESRKTIEDIVIMHEKESLIPDVNPYGNPYSMPARVFYGPPEFGKGKPLVVYFLKGTFEELVFEEHKLRIGEQIVEISPDQKSLITYIYGKSLAESISDGVVGDELPLEPEKFLSMRIDIQTIALRATALMRTYEFLQIEDRNNPAMLYIKNLLIKFMANNYLELLNSISYPEPLKGTLKGTEAEVIVSLSARYNRLVQYLN